MPAIWFATPTLDALNRPAPTLVAHLGIQFTEIGDDYLVATMPVDHRTHQPMGLLHGGASVALAETMGSVGAFLSVDTRRFSIVGLEINANHIRSVKSGHVIGRATPLHMGRSTQLWDIRISDTDGKLVCVSKITIAVLENKASA
jgi:1,4-dihydroxy-2-naphthoyl-CoA hydrolase